MLLKILMLNLFILKIHSNDIKTYDQLNNLMNSSDLNEFFLIYFEENSYINEIKNKIGSWMNYILVDKLIFKGVKEFDKIYTDKSIHMILFPYANINVRFKKMKFISSNDNIKILASYINEELIEPLEEVEENNWQLKISQVIQSGKFPIILFIKGDNPLLTFKIIAKQKKFQYNFKFLINKNTTNKVKDLLQLERIPSISIFFIDPKPDKEENKGKVTVLHYVKSILYNKVEEFLTNFENSKLNNNTNYTQPEHKESNNKELIEIKNNKDFNENCNTKNKYCLLGILNKSENENFDEKIKYLKQIQNLYRSSTLKVSYFDGICYHKLLSNFDISYDDLPRAIFIDTSKSEYYNIIGKFDKNDILFTFSKIINNRIISNNIDLKNIQFNIENCEKEKIDFNNKLKNIKEENNEDDEMIKKIVEESQKKEKEKEFLKEKKRRRRRTEL